MPQRTPIYAAAAEAGATFREEGGWLIPAHYGDPAAEYQAACRTAALFDLSHHGKVEVAGPDARSFLHNLCTNDVKALEPGAGCEAFLTTSQAKITAYVLIDRTAWPDDRDLLLLDAGPGMGAKVVQHLDRYLISEQVELADRTPAVAAFHLAGPQARQVLEQALQEKLPDLAPLRHVVRTLAGARCLIRRQDPLGLPGHDLFCPHDQAVAVWKALRAAGARPAGIEAHDTLRIEAGTPVYGRDIDETNLPQEVARTDRTVSFTKGCYIGQETVARIRTYGHVNRSLVGLRLAGDAPVPPGTKLFYDEKEVGQVTSSARSPRLGTAVALAYVRRGSQEPGTALEVETEGGRRSAAVVSLPFLPAGAGAA